MLHPNITGYGCARGIPIEMKHLPSSPNLALDGSQFVVEVLSELPKETIQGRWSAINVVLRLSMITGLQMQLESTLNLLCDYAQEIVQYDAALVYFWSEEEDRFGLRVARGIPRSKSAPANIFSYWAAKYTQPLLVRRGDSAADAFFKDSGTASCLVVPLFMNNRVMGSLQLVSKVLCAFTVEDAQLLWMLSLAAENLLTREAANEGLMRFAFTDYLTGLRSRGYFEQQLEVEIKRTDRKNVSFVLLMIDIDRFKDFNDTYGHQFGDQVLREVSAILVRDMREVDTVARYGGEEFVIILPETDARGALQVAERLRRSVEQTSFSGGDAGGPQQLTISIGIAVFGRDGLHRHEILQAADAALYEAKARGRNCIVTYAGFGG